MEESFLAVTELEINYLLSFLEGDVPKMDNFWKQICSDPIVLLDSLWAELKDGIAAQQL